VKIWARYARYNEDMIDIFKVLDRKHEAKIPYRRQRLRWEDNIKTNPREIGCDTAY
jgi:hypothetical protein